MPQEDYEIHDAAFAGLVHFNAAVETLWKGGRWCEGPVYVPAGRYLLWSDIPNNRVMRWDECSGAVSTFEVPSRNKNGHSLDPFGRVVACEHQGRAVSRIGFNGQREVLADSFNGGRFNSPNDVVVKSDGSVWFTDPTYGIDSEYEGDAAHSEQPVCGVYRIDPDGSVSLVADDLLQPNGLAFSRDETLLYLSDTGFTHDASRTPRIRSYSVTDNGRALSDGRDLVLGDHGLFDGFRLDRFGNIWTSAGKGVNCYTPDGSLLGRIPMDDVVANVAFGGPKRNRLFICATTTMRAVFVNTVGL